MHIKSTIKYSLTENKQQQKGINSTIKVVYIKI